jgi:hypothetical protein
MIYLKLTKKNSSEYNNVRNIKRITRILKKSYKIFKATNLKNIKKPSLFSISIISFNFICVYVVVNILPFLSLWSLCLTPALFFISLAIIDDIKIKLLKLKYKGINDLFYGQANIVKRIKEGENLVYTLNSFLPKVEIIKLRSQLEQYLNTNVIEIKQDKVNMRIFTITTNKYIKVRKIDNVVDKLTNILRGYNFIPEYVSHNETDFSINVTYEIEESVNNIKNKLDDITFKLGKSISMNFDNSNYTFEIAKDVKKAYNYRDYVKYTDIKGKKLPFILGLNHRTGNPITLDLVDVRHTFINGIQGSGKSCLFNTIIQSIMCFSNDVSFIMADFKLVELNQYKTFENTTFITELDDFNIITKELIKEMNERYNKMANSLVKNIQGYQKKIGKMPYIILCIDECSNEVAGFDNDT